MSKNISDDLSVGYRLKTYFNYYIKNLEIEKNLIFVTHYVFISEVLNYGPSSGEIVVSDKNLNIIGSLEIDF